MALADTGEAPYAPAESVWAVIETYRERSLATPVTAEVVSRCGVKESLSRRVLRTLKVLDLLTEEGEPTATFEAIRVAPTDQLEEVIGGWLRNAYEPIFRYTDPAVDDVQRVIDQFRHYEPAGQRNRMVTLFYGLCVKAGILAETPPMPRSKTASGAAKKAGPNGANKASAPKSSDKEPRVPAPQEPAAAQPPPAASMAPTDPLLAAFFAKLPPSGSVVTSEERSTWLSTLSGIFAMVYEEAPE